MKIRILSDLHNEFSVYRPEKVKSDIVVLAGDINLGMTGVEWAVKSFPAIPVIYVAGNHEYYSQVMEKLNEDLKEFSDRHPHFHFLEKEGVVINGYRFLGCTLWTDFLLFGSEMEEVARKKSEEQISDFFRIKIQNNSYPEKLRTWNMVHEHRESFNFLKVKMEENFNGKTIVVTHHAPSAKSLPHNYRRDVLSAAFATNMEEFILKYKPDLWIHGHTHFNADYNLNGTRIVSNQRGYFPMQVCKQFNEEFYIEL